MTNNLKDNPLALMMAVSVESSMKFDKAMNDLIQKYKNSGVDVIPISEIEEAQAATLKEALGGDGLLHSILTDKGEQNGK